MQDDKIYSKYVSEAFQIRNNVDYADFYIVSRSDAEEQIKHTEELIRVIREYLKML